jgi:hypothetical protein
VIYGFAGTVGEADCQRESVAGLIQQFGDLLKAASTLKFSVPVLQATVGAFCGE